MIVLKETVYLPTGEPEIHEAKYASKPQLLKNLYCSMSAVSAADLAEKQVSFESSPTYSKNSADGFLKQKNNGAFYTPFWLASRLVDQCSAHLSADQIRKFKVLDPACGEGVFLVAFAELAIRKFNLSPLKIASMIHGADLEKSEADKAKNNLLEFFKLHAGDSEVKKISKILNANIRSCNSLTFFNTSNFSGTFDLVVGNPPWRIQRNRKDFDELTGTSNFKRKDDRQLIEAKSKWNLESTIKDDGEPDIYLSFLALALKLKSKNGIVGFILPDSFLINSNATEMRQKMLELGSMAVEGYVNGKKAFDADVRKKFETVRFHNLGVGRLEVSFGGVAGRTLENSITTKPIQLTVNFLKKFSDRLIIPDIRTQDELQILSKVLQSQVRLGDFLNDTTSFKLSQKKTQFVRGADIQFLKTAQAGSLEMDLIWRKITKDDNTRTLLVNLIEKDTAYDKNSVHRIAPMSPDLLFKCFAYMNSTICDFTLKTQITVNATRESLLGLPAPDLSGPKFNLIGALYALGYFQIKAVELSEIFDEVSIKRAQQKIKSFGKNKQIETFLYVEKLLCDALEIKESSYEELQRRRFKTFNVMIKHHGEFACLNEV